MQKDLFGTASVSALSESLAAPKADFLDRYRFTLKLDQALVGLIGLLVVYVLLFSFGVETGKRYAMAELRAERAKREMMTEELSRKIFSKNALMANAQSAAVVESSVPAAAPKAELASQPAAPAAAQPALSGPVSQTAPKAAATPSVAVAGKGKYTIQVVTVTTKVRADQVLQGFAKKGQQGYVIPGKKILQVCLGGFEAYSEADRVMKQLKAEKLIPEDAYIRPTA